MPSRIFVNYRRQDAAAQARGLYDRLERAFGAGNVFMDVDRLKAGQRFDKELEKALATSGVLLAVIGPRWMEILAERRASDERDFVCDEIAAAIGRDVMVIPVLVDGASLPRSDDLPEDIRELVLHQALRLTHERFGRDVDDLVEAIAEGENGVRLLRSRRAVGAMWAGAGTAVAAAAGVAVWQWPHVETLLRGAVPVAVVQRPPAPVTDRGSSDIAKSDPVPPTAEVAAKRSDVAAKQPKAPEPSPKASTATAVAPSKATDVTPTEGPRATTANAKAAAPGSDAARGTDMPRPKARAVVPRMLQSTVADVVDRVAPVTVSLSVLRQAPASPSAKGTTNGAAGEKLDLAKLPPEWREFFSSLERSRPEQRTPSASSYRFGRFSGVVVSPSGFIVTSASVVNDAARIMATLSDGSRHEAHVVGVDAVTGLAVLKLLAGKEVRWTTFAKGLPPAGEALILIGNSLGMGHSVRSVRLGARPSEPAGGDGIELDGALLDGEAGAPMFDLNAEIIAVTRIAPAGEGLAGTGVPGPVVKVVLDQIIASGQVSDRQAVVEELGRLWRAERPATHALVPQVSAGVEQRARTAIVEVSGGVAARETSREPGAATSSIGTIISEAGHIVVAARAIGDWRDFWVTLADGSRHAAWLVGKDSRTGIALLQIDARRKLLFLPLARGQPRSGDFVLGIGGGSIGEVVLRRGLISHPEREGAADGPYPMLQTIIGMEERDTGPIISHLGEVLGLSNTVSSSAGGTLSVASAIPARLVAEITEKLKATGKVERGWLGVKIINVNEEMAKKLGRPDQYGVVLSEVTERGPAEAAGLKTDDLVLAVDGSRINDARHLARKIAEYAPNVLIDVRLLRQGREMNVNVRLGRFPSE